MDATDNAIAIMDSYKKLITLIREKSRIIAPEYPRIDEDLEVHEHLWAITSSYEGTELANGDLHEYIKFLLSRLGWDAKKGIDEYRLLYGKMPINSEHIFQRYADLLKKYEMLQQTNKGLMKRMYKS